MGSGEWGVEEDVAHDTFVLRTPYFLFSFRVKSMVEYTFAEPLMSHFPLYRRKRITDRTTLIWQTARRSASVGGKYVEPEHLLSAIVVVNRGVGRLVLEELGVDLPLLVLADLTPSFAPTTTPPRSWYRRIADLISGRRASALATPNVKPRPSVLTRRVLRAAHREAVLMEMDYVGSEHVLLGLVSVVDSPAAQSLRAHGIGYENVRAKTLQIFGPSIASQKT